MNTCLAIYIQETLISVIQVLNWARIYTYQVKIALSFVFRIWDT